MNLPMKQQPAQQQPAQQNGKGKAFPQNRAEALKFSNDMLEVLYNEEINNNLVKQIASLPKQVPAETGIGMIAAQLLGNRFADVRAQTGRPIDIRYAAGAANAVATEIVGIAEKLGTKLDDKQKIGVLKEASRFIDDAAMGGQNGRS